jgi:hypothetical protein
MTRRILITGSRDWTDYDAIFDALKASKDYLGEITVVHGGASGADSTAGIIAHRLGLKVEVHPADWEKHGKKAGFVRNSEMVKEGADFVLAFIKNDSKGATMCASLAEKAGIPVKYFREDS